MDIAKEVARITGEKAAAVAARYAAREQAEEETARIHRMEGALYILNQLAAEQANGNIDDHTGADPQPVADADPGSDSSES